MNQVGIHFGAMSDDIEVQLKAQGLKIENVGMYQKQAHAITVLNLADIATDSQTEMMRKKLLKRIFNNVEAQS